MKMRMSLAVVLVLVILFTGCASQPAWFNQPDDETMLYGVGTAQISNQSTAWQAATTRARQDLALQIEALVEAMRENYEKSADSSSSEFFSTVGRELTSVVLQGAQIVNREAKSNNNYYVRVSYKKEDLRNAYTAFAENEAANNTEFQAQTALAAMDAQLEKRGMSGSVKNNSEAPSSGKQNVQVQQASPVQNPSNADAEKLLQNANAAMARGDNNLAIGEYTAYLRLNPTDPEALVNRGRAYAAMKDYDKAIADYDAALRSDPSYTEARDNKRRAQSAQQQQREEEEKAKVEALVASGFNYYQQQNYDRAIAEYDTALLIDPSYTNAITRKREAQKAKLDQAERERQANAKMEADARVRAGDSYQALEQYNRAIAEYDAALLIDPKNYEAFTKRQTAQTQKQQQTSQVQQANAKAEADNLVERGQTYMKNKDYDRAAADFDAALQVNPGHIQAGAQKQLVENAKKDADAFVTSGLAYYVNENYDLAIAQYDAALRVYPGHTQAGTNRLNALNAKQQAATKPQPAAKDQTPQFNITVNTSNTNSNDSSNNNSNQATITEYTGISPNLNIPSLYNGYPVTMIGPNAFSGAQHIASVTISPSITVIGSYAFNGCQNLTNVAIPSTVTRIESYAFYGCPKLSSVVLSRRTTLAPNAFPSWTRITYRD
ncbi:tetratricopeptide repeat protein [Breznakiellaceae bacterium SP9]